MRSCIVFATAIVFATLATTLVQGRSLDSDKVRLRLQASQLQGESTSQLQGDSTTAPLGEKVCLRIGQGSETAYTDKGGGATTFTPLLKSKGPLDVDPKFTTPNYDNVTPFQFHVVKTKKLNCRINIFTKHSHMGSLGLPIAGRTGLWARFLKKVGKDKKDLTNPQAVEYAKTSVSLKTKRSRLYDTAKDVPNHGILILGQCNPDYFSQLQTAAKKAENRLEVNLTKADAKIAELAATIDPADPLRQRIVYLCNKKDTTSSVNELVTMVSVANFHYQHNPHDPNKWESTRVTTAMGAPGSTIYENYPYVCRPFSLALLKLIDAFQMNAATFTPDSY